MASSDTTNSAVGAEAAPHAGTVAEGGHAEGKSFPPLDASTFPSQILWLAVFFGLLYVLMSKLVLPRFDAIMHNRKSTIDGDIATARNLQEQTSAALAAYEKALSQARAEAQEHATETRNKLSAEVDAERAALEAEIADKLTAADKRILTAKTKALTHVKDIASEAAIDIVERLTGAKTTKTAAAKAVAGKA